MEPATAKHSGDDGVDGDVSPGVVDGFVVGRVVVGEKVFEAFDFFAFAKHDSHFFYGEDVAFAVVLMFFYECF